MERLHVTIDESTIGGRRVFVFGDVHGCYDELVDLLGRAEETAPGNVLYISVGDLINRGPMSAQVVSLVRNRGILAIRGNHEENFNTREPDVREKISACPGADKRRHKVPPELAIYHHYSFTKCYHCPCRPDIPAVPLAMQDPYALTCMRNVVKRQHGGYRPYSETDKGEPWASVWPGPEHVYYGHDARRGRDGIQKHEYATGLDTRCVKGGQLTGVFLDGAKEVLSVPAKMTYFNG